MFCLRCCNSILDCIQVHILETIIECISYRRTRVMSRNADKLLWYLLCFAAMHCFDDSPSCRSCSMLKSICNYVYNALIWVF